MTNDDDRGLDEAFDAIIEGALSEKLGLGAKAEWVPYQGPQGGVGWENTETGDKHYGDTPPGGTPEGIPNSASEIEEQIESGELTQEDLEEAYGGGGDADGGPGYEPPSDREVGPSGVDKRQFSNAINDRDLNDVVADVEDIAGEPIDEVLPSVWTDDDGELTGDDPQHAVVGEMRRQLEPEQNQELMARSIPDDVDPHNMDPRDPPKRFESPDGRDYDLSFVEEGDTVSVRGDEREVLGVNEEDGKIITDNDGREAELHPGNLSKDEFRYGGNEGTAEELAADVEAAGPDSFEVDGVEYQRAVDSTASPYYEGPDGEQVYPEEAAELVREGDDGGGPDMAAAEEALAESDVPFDYNDEGISAAAGAAGGLDEGTLDAMRDAGYEPASIDTSGDRADVQFSDGGQHEASSEPDMAAAEEALADADQAFDYVGDGAIETHGDYGEGMDADDVAAMREAGYEVASVNGGGGVRFEQSGGADGKLSTEEEIDEKLAERIQEKLDERLDFSDRVAAKASWVPYQGPQGGVGWRNTETGEKIYDDEPPGGTPGDLPDDLDELRDRVKSGELTEDDVREAVADQSAMDAEGDPTETGVVTAEDLEEGETVMIDGVEAEVSRKSDMGGGFYIAGRDESGEVHTARVGPTEEFGQPVTDDLLAETSIDQDTVSDAQDEFKQAVLQEIPWRKPEAQVAAEAGDAFEGQLDKVRQSVEEGRGDPADYGISFVARNALRDMDIDRKDQDDIVDRVETEASDNSGGDGGVEELDGDQVEEVVADHVSDGGTFYQGTAGARGSSSELDALEERLEGTDHAVVDRGPAGAFFDEAESAEVVREDSKAGQAYMGKDAVRDAGVEASNLMANQSGLQVGGRDADLDRAKEAVAEATDMDLVQERDDFVKFEPSEIRARNQPLELRSDYRDRATRGSAGSTSESLGGGEVRMNVHGGTARDMGQAASKAIRWLDRHDPDPDEDRLRRLKELKSDIDAQNDPMRDTEIRTDAKNLEALAESGGDIDTYMTEREDVTDPDDDRHRDMTRTLNTAKTVLGAAQQDAAGADQKARIVDDVAGAIGEALQGDLS